MGWKTASQCVKEASQCIKAASQFVKALVRLLTEESSVLIYSNRCPCDAFYCNLHNFCTLLPVVVYSCSHISFHEHMSLKDEQLMAIQHIGRDVSVWLPDTASSYLVLPFVLVPHIHFEKAEAAYHRHKLSIVPWCSSTLQSYISPNISLCYYLPVQLMYLDELYAEM